ncbi:MAG TPA: glycosyltransferase family 2 protein [Chthonomonadaceae bacterium]|nr:glycosyltransferase family 2 protein [Chthonomonadaceae bacterium]
MTVLASLHGWGLLHVLLSGTAFLAWLVFLGLLVGFRYRYPLLAEVPFAPEEMASLPTLSILVPACNEEQTIERAMCSLLDLAYPCFEIIAIDDRSTDGTGAILDRMAALEPRLRVLHIKELPPGWLGKNHALQVASDEAAGEWLLFTDADVVFAPEALRRAVAYAHTRDIDHLVLSPSCETHGFWERLMVSYFGIMFSFRVRPWAVSSPRSTAYVGLGVFNLVRAAAYRQAGGHRALKLDVTDDTKLGKVLKRSGFRQKILEGSDLLSVRWVIGLRGMIEGLAKNAFAGFDFRFWTMVRGIGSLALVTLYPVVALLLPFWPTRLLAAGTFLLMAAGAATMRRVTQARAWYGLAYPLAGLVLIYIILRSTWRAYRQNGIVWRGTLYPLEELKKGVV